MSDDPPVDLNAVAADDAALEALRDGAGDDAALVLLRELLLDVERDLPDVPVGHGTTVVALALAGPERRLARNGTVVAALTAGLLSLGGVAAASTLVPSGTPLHGLGEAVRSAAGAVVGAVTPPQTPVRSAAVLPTSTASPAAPAAAAAAPRTPTPGATVSAASRSRAAARQVDQLLDDAAVLVDAGRTSAATTRLDLAERKLADVLPADRADLPQRLAELRARAAAEPAAAPSRPAKPAPAPPAPARQDEPRAEPPAKQQSEPRGSARTAPPRNGGGDRSDGRSLLGQLSKDASVKPRA